MRKENLTTRDMFVESLTIFMLIGYIVLQLVYGIYYGVPIYRYFMNILGGILVYAGLFVMQRYPEKIHKTQIEEFAGEIRQLTISELRWVKFLFVFFLLIPCIFDVLGKNLTAYFSPVAIGAILFVVFFYEYRIINIFKNHS